MRYVIFFGILFLIEFYSYLGGSQALSDKTWQLYRALHLVGGTVLFCQVYIVTYYIPSQQGTGNTFTTIIAGLMMAFAVAKLILVLFFFGEDLWRVFKFSFEYAFISKEVSLVDRRSFLTNVGLGVAALPFASLVYGVLKGRYDFKVHRVKLKFKELPKAFHGFTIAQISDVHSGSFDGSAIVKKGLSLLQSQNPDMILFTGDLVNNYAHEIEPYISLFQDLKAPYGKYSVMGNHDYGSYGRWENEGDLQQNAVDFKAHNRSMGFDLLDNQSRLIKKEGDSIRLVGVENWGKPPFPQKGDLDEALVGVDNKEFTVLMSHDPDHWEQRVLPHEKNISITLAGHTHGMQFGVEIPGFKWSPVKYKYPRWAGLYKESNQYLYVNRGFGYIGYPGRFGIWPEITLIELQKV